MACGWFYVASSGDNVQGGSCLVSAVLGFSGVFLVVMKIGASFD